MKRVTGYTYETGSDIPNVLMIDINKSYSYERIIHAHWVSMDKCGLTKCSHCGWKRNTDCSHCGWKIEGYIEYKRCPECGAYMDEISESR